MSSLCALRWMIANFPHSPTYFPFLFSRDTLNSPWTRTFQVPESVLLHASHFPPTFFFGKLFLSSGGSIQHSYPVRLKRRQENRSKFGTLGVTLH